MLTHGALHRLAIDRPPVSRASEFREPMARHKESGWFNGVGHSGNCKIFGIYMPLPIY